MARPPKTMYHGTSKPQLERLLREGQTRELFLADVEEKAWEYAERQASIDDSDFALLVVDTRRLPGTMEVDPGVEYEEEYDLGQWIYSGEIPVRAIVKAVYVDVWSDEEISMLPAREDNRQRNPENIGREWGPPGSRKKVVGVHPSGAYLVEIEGQRFPQLVQPQDLESEIAFDERAAASRARSQRQIAIAREEEAAEQRQRDFTYGFAEQFPSLRRPRVIETLNRQVRSGSRYLSRKDLIAELVRDGWKVENDRLVAPDGNRFLFQKDLTKLGLDFARYLERHPEAFERTPIARTSNRSKLRNRLMR